MWGDELDIEFHRDAANSLMLLKAALRVKYTSAITS
jgi:hypothetical protein